MSPQETVSRVGVDQAADLAMTVEATGDDTADDMGDVTWADDRNGRPTGGGAGDTSITAQAS